MQGYCALADSFIHKNTGDRLYRRMLSPGEVKAVLQNQHVESSSGMMKTGWIS